VGTLLWGTVTLRPYVVAFLAVFLLIALRDVGPRGALAFLAWGGIVAFAAEWCSTRVGFPFGDYRYTGATAGVELFLSNVPLFSPLSFPFLSYAAWCVARVGLPRMGRTGGAVGAGLIMMVLDVVIDPLAVRGAHWFLGHLFDYPDGGFYFGVPASNFAGWVVCGALIVGGAVVTSRCDCRPLASPWPGVGLYYGVLAFNLGMTLWIGEIALALAGFVVHAGLFLLLCVGLERVRNFVHSDGMNVNALQRLPGVDGADAPLAKARGLSET
jgi:uncharacterized membrane protein